jgi:hypothetical protein
MDESKPSFPSDELSLQPASDWKWAVVDAPPADLAKSDRLAAPGRQNHSDQFIALRAMGVAVVEQPPEPVKPPVAGAKP